MISRARADSFLRRYLERAPVSLALERAIEARLVGGLDLVPPTLDIGCGDGLFASIAFRGRVEIGYDPAVEELRLARARDAYMHVVAGTGEQIPFASGSFGTVLSNSTLEHVAEPGAVFAEIARVLREGGSAVVTVPTPRYQRLFFWSRALRRARLPALARAYERGVNAVFRHRHVHSAEKWAAIAERNGLVVERVIPYLSPRVIALDDLLYPVAAPSLLWKRITGSYVPALGRRPIAAVLARLLRGAYAEDAGRDGGGYVLIVARKAP